jgi:hypothetical protein
VCSGVLHYQVMKILPVILMLCLCAGCATQKVVTPPMPPIPQAEFIPIPNATLPTPEPTLISNAKTNEFSIKYVGDTHRAWTLEVTKDFKSWTPVSWTPDRDYLTSRTIMVKADNQRGFYRMKSL